MNVNTLISLFFGILFLYWGASELININKPRAPVTLEQALNSYKWWLIIIGVILIFMGLLTPKPRISTEGVSYSGITGTEM